jgi:hypothetical protein
MSMIEPKPLKARLSTRQWNVYMAVVDAGSEGISASTLLEKHLPGRKKGSLRTCVYGINMLIKPQRLEGRGLRYFLGRTSWNEEKTE